MSRYYKPSGVKDDPVLVVASFLIVLASLLGMLFLAGYLLWTVLS